MFFHKKILNRIGIFYFEISEVGTVMFKFTKFALLMAVCSFAFAGNANAEEQWEMGQPGTANIGKNIDVNVETLGLFVPKSFEGRKAKETRFNYGFEFNRLIRYVHSTSEVEVTGRNSEMPFDYKRDAIDVQIFRSKEKQPNISACMDCHGDSLPRTTAVVGYSKTSYENEPYRSGNTYYHINDAETDYFRAEINHWLDTRFMLKFEFKIGNVKQGKYDFGAHAVTLGIGGSLQHRLTWSADWTLSKVQNFKNKNTLVLRGNYRLYEGLKLKAELGAFLNGYTTFGTNMSEMGSSIAETVRDNEDWLPSIFEKLKDKTFGYWNVCLEYEYKFK